LKVGLFSADGVVLDANEVAGTVEEFLLRHESFPPFSCSE
jgi:hypothetical protein